MILEKKNNILKKYIKKKNKDAENEWDKWANIKNKTTISFKGINQNN